MLNITISCVRSIQGRDFLELWLPKKKKEKFVYLTDNLTQNFLEGEQKKKIRKEKPKVRSLTWVMVLERKSTTGRFATGERKPVSIDSPSPPPPPPVANLNNYGH